MELVLTTQDLDPLPSDVKCEFEPSNQGILNTSYKRIARANLLSSNPESVSSVRKRIRSQRLCNTIITPDAFLKFALFMAVALFVV